MDDMYHDLSSSHEVLHISAGEIQMLHQVFYHLIYTIQTRIDIGAALMTGFNPIQ